MVETSDVHYIQDLYDESHNSSRNIGTSVNSGDNSEELYSDILCLFQKCNKIGAASYNILSCEVKILGSFENYRPDYAMIKNLLSYTLPRLILCNKNAPRDFIEKIQDSMSDQQSFKLLPVSAFNYENYKDVFLSTSLINCAADKENYLNSVINTADERLVCVIGALFTNLKEILSTLFPNRHSEVLIKSISLILFDNIVWIDNETYKCLQVFDMLQHPSAFKWSKCRRDNSEGLSVYSLIEKYCCLLGSSKVKNFLSSPLNDCNELLKRHEVIKFCSGPKNFKVTESMKSQMSHLSPNDVLMANVESANVRGKHWKYIYQNIYYSVLLAETCKQNSDGVKLFQEIGNLLTDEMYEMAYHLDRIINFQSMEGNEIFVLKEGVSDSLEKAKQKFYEMMSTINKIVPYEFDAVPDYIDKIHMLYIPEMKFLLSIPYWKQNLSKENLELPGLDYKFTSNRAAYYKSKRCYELDNLYGDPQIQVMMEEANIIRALGNYIRKNIKNTLLLIDKIATLDCIFSLAALAKECDYVEPVLSNEKKISILSGVHPLLKLCTNEFIPNNVESNPERSLVKIIYGPNSSGKTVYLKQIALLTYLAHIGSFIPAQEATIGMCCHIHTRLSSTESIISGSSSFMNDLRKLVAIVNNSYSTSLLILDEIGKGTTEINAVAILASCMNHFLSLGSQCPHIAISTHLTSISDYIQSKNLFSVQVMNYSIENGKYVYLYSVKDQSDIARLDIGPEPFPDVPDCISISAYKALFALRHGENVTPYTEMRLRKYKRYYNFLEKFSITDTKKEDIVAKLRKKLTSIMS